ncbi:MAG TPA: hypothetical protein V6D14_30290 [Coleofasciculaceae cyanobacterium]|jgi:hypothetical protein
MSKIQPTLVWKLTKPYWVIGKIAVLVLGSLVYLQLVEGLRRFSKASEALAETDSDGSAWDKQDIVDLP